MVEIVFVGQVPVNKGLTASTNETATVQLGFIVHSCIMGKRSFDLILKLADPAMSYIFCSSQAYIPNFQCHNVFKPIRKGTSKAICASNTASTTSAATRTA
jgi:hypothetical protein